MRPASSWWLALVLCALLVVRAFAQDFGPEDDFEDFGHGDHDHDHGDHGHSHGDHGHAHTASPVVQTNDKYDAPTPSSSVFFEPFDDAWASRWTLISNGKYNGQFALSAPKKNPGIPGDKGLVVPEKAKHYAAVAKFPAVVNPSGKDFVVQYEVRMQEGLECGGAYLKLLTASTLGSLDSFSNETPYTIMFGPDKCGTTSKVHFIFRHQNPITKEFEEKHLKNPPAVKSDKLTHLYTLHVRPDNTFTLSVDQESQSSGSLLEDFEPAVNPPKEIDDPTDKKPANWVDEETIPDPDDKKPSDWDDNAPATIPDADAVKPQGWLDHEPAQVPDPTARKPDDWSDADDGEWIAPLVPNPRCEDVGCGKWERPTKANPNYKGKWTARDIPNPKYKGPWSPRKIANPNWFEDLQPAKFRPIGAVGIEIWTMTDGILFDNILITQDKSAADAYAKATFTPKHAVELANAEPEPADTFNADKKDKTLIEKAQDIVFELRKRMEDPYVFWATVAAATLPILVMLLWPAPKPAAAVPAAAAPAAAATPAAAEKKEENNGEENKKKKTGKNKSQQ